MARRNCLDPNAGDLDGLIGPDLDHLPRTELGAPSAQPTWHDQDRVAGQPFEGSLIEVVGMTVRDNDDVGLELGRVGEGTVALEGAEPRSEEGVRQDASTTEVEQCRRVADEPNRDRSGPGRLRVRSSARRSGHRPAPGRGAAGSDDEGG